MKTKNTITLSIIAAALLFFSSCYKSALRIEGNNILIEETRELPEFNKVANEGPFLVYLIPDTESYVVLEAESNLIPYIRTRISGTTLEIDSRENLRNHEPMKLYVHSPHFYGAYLSGSGAMYGTGLNEDAIEIILSGSGDIGIDAEANLILALISGSGSMDILTSAESVEGRISGSGDMRLSGGADNAIFNISGSGNIRAYDMGLREADVTISGSGNLYLAVEEYLKVLISGSGSVYYLGNPVISSTITGSGSIIHP